MQYRTLFTIFLAEMRVAIDMSCIAPVEASLALDPMSINVGFKFYSNSKEDIY